MDWNNVLSTAIGTLGGTLITVLAAWVIYTFEKKDAESRRKKQEVYSIATDATSTVLSIDLRIQNMQFMMHQLTSIKNAQKIMQFIDLKDEEYKELVHLSAKLEVLSATIFNLSGLDIHEKIETYLENVKDFSINDLALDKFNNESSIDKTIELDTERADIINELQIIIAHSLDIKVKYR